MKHFVEIMIHTESSTKIHNFNFVLSLRNYAKKYQITSNLIDTIYQNHQKISINLIRLGVIQEVGVEMNPAFLSNKQVLI